MQKRKVLFKHRLEYILFMAFVYTLKISPPFFFNLHKRWLRFLFETFNSRHSRIISRNLEIAFPDKKPGELAALKKSIIRHFSDIFMEIIYLYVKKKPGKILDRVSVHNLEILERTLEKGRGLILFSAHFGNWELIPLILNRQLKRQVTSIARKMDNPLIERVVRNFREYLGSTVIYKKGSIRTIIKTLEDNRIVYLLVDQNTIPREGVFVDFFSKKVCAVTSVSQLHLKRDIPAVPVFLHYEKNGIVLDILEEVAFEKTENHDQDVLRLTQELTSLIEAMIKKYPEQWFWFHNRWKTGPQGDRHEK